MPSADPDPQTPDPAFRCSPWTRAQGVDPIGSAATYDALLLVAWPLPWPADVAEIPVLAEASRVPGVRVMAVVPAGEGAGSGTVAVVHRQRAGTNHLVGTDHEVDVASLPELLATLAAEPLSDHRGLPSAIGDSPPEVLVCAHGRRDACCGRWGTLLHVELAARWTGVRVWRCSHTGGHRFAPTAITLPDGRAWAYADPTLLDAVVHRRGELTDVLAHDRGTSGLDPWAQVVERALFREHGWAWLDEDLTHVHVEVAPDGQRAEVELAWARGSASATVEIVRTLPVLVCGEPPERATKTAPEYALARLDVTGRDPSGHR